MSHARIWLMIALAAAVAWTCAADPPSLRATSDGQHAWMVVQRMGKKSPEWLLLHHAVAMDGALCRQVTTLDDCPAAMAAGGARLWMIMPARDVLRPRREVYGVTAHRHQGTGAYYYEPERRLAIYPSVPEGGVLAGAASDGHRLYALSVPGPLLVLTDTTWEPVQNSPAAQWVVTVNGEVGVVQTQGPDNSPGDLVMSRLDPTSPGHWRSVCAPLPAGAVQPAVWVSGAVQPAVLYADQKGEWTLAYVVDGRVAPLAVLPPAHGAWNVVGLGGGFALLEATATGEVMLRTIDVANGKLSDPQALQPQQASSAEWVHLILLGMLFICLVLSVVLLRGAGQQAMLDAPAGWAPAGAPRRVGALVLDLVPGVGLVLLTGTAPASLAAFPLWSTSISQSVPWLIAAGVSLGCCVVVEAATGASLGKWLTGLRVVCMDPPGARPRAWQSLVRNTFKGFLLLVPLAGLFTLMSPGGRGPGEVVSRTAVVLRSSQPLKPSGDDRR